MCPDDAEASSLRARFRGAFLGCIVGDAIGRPFEMSSPNDNRIGAALQSMLEGSAPWRYTDDGEMMIAVGESLARSGGVSATDLLASFAASYDPSRGYGHGMKLALAAFESGRRVAAFASWAEGSKGNGGAVRVVPIACAYHDDFDLLAALAEESAGTTHAHPLGRAGAIVHALAIACALRHRGGWDRVATEHLLRTVRSPPLVANSKLASKLGAVRALVEAGASSPEAARALGNGTLAEEAVPLALFCFLRWGSDFAQVTTNAVLAGGDTDTIAAMSGALCGALVGEEGIPESWPRRLEHEPKGPAHVRSLADATLAIWAMRARLGSPARAFTRRPTPD
jgi:poly(ADP-ribose) glycohydrolase ARH3